MSENYIVAFKYRGILPIPEDWDQAVAGIHSVMLPKLQLGEYEFFSIRRLFPSDRSELEQYKEEEYGPTSILEVKLALKGVSKLDNAAITCVVLDGLMKGQYLVERIDENLVTGPPQSIITISQRKRNRRWLTTLSHRGELKNLQQPAEMLRHLIAAGEVTIVGTELSQRVEYCQPYVNADDGEGYTIFEVRLLINEFNVNFADTTSVLDYIAGQLEYCDTETAYQYRCGEREQIAVIGIEVYCHYQAIEFDDYDDLIQQL